MYPHTHRPFDVPGCERCARARAYAAEHPDADKLLLAPTASRFMLDAARRAEDTSLTLIDRIMAVSEAFGLANYACATFGSASHVEDCIGLAKYRAELLAQYDDSN